MRVVKVVVKVVVERRRLTGIIKPFGSLSLSLCVLLCGKEMRKAIAKANDCTETLNTKPVLDGV